MQLLLQIFVLSSPFIKFCSAQDIKSGEKCWDPFLNRFFLGTMNCENTFSDRTCDALFAHNKLENQERISSGKPPIASENCDNPAMREHALKCAKHCFICCERPEFSCKNPRTSANFNCDEKLKKCRDPVWIDVLAEKCPRTCGLCNYKRPTNRECRDVDGFCQDKDISLLCNHEILEGRMAKLCPKTCSKCDKLQNKDSNE